MTTENPETGEPRTVTQDELLRLFDLHAKVLQTNRRLDDAFSPFTGDSFVKIRDEAERLRDLAGELHVVLAPASESPTDAEALAAVAYMLWQFSEGYIKAEDRAVGRNWMMDDEASLHVEDVESKAAFMDAARDLLASGLVVARAEHEKKLSEAEEQHLAMHHAFRPEVVAEIAVNLGDHEMWDRLVDWCGGKIDTSQDPSGEYTSTLVLPNGEAGGDGSWLVLDHAGEFHIRTVVAAPELGDYITRAKAEQREAEAWDAGLRFGQLHWATNYAGVYQNGSPLKQAPNPFRRARTTDGGQA